MHRWPPLLRALEAAMLLFLAALPARAEDSEAAAAEAPAPAGEPIPEERAIDWSEWTPSVFGGIAIVAQDVSSHVRGRYSTIWDTRAGGPVTLEDQFEKTLNGPYFPFGVELMGPSLLRLPGKPRFFVQGGYGWSREEKNWLARSFIIDFFPLPAVGTLPQSTIQMFAKPEDLILAGLGSSFQFQLGDYPVFFKPSLNFFAQRAVVDGLVVQEVFRPGPPITQVDLRPSARVDQWFYYVGPQLELAAEVGRQGAVGFQVFATTAIAFAISDRDISFGGLGETLDPDDPDSFYFQYDNLRITGGAGLRLLWYGAD